jgi:hypothetical protein
MAYEATSERAGPLGRVRTSLAVGVERARASESLRAAWSVFWWSRLAIAAVAVYAALSAGGGGLPGRNAERFDNPALTHPLGGFGDTVLSPLARWDAVWYLTVADGGYESADSPRQAFFPLYPMLSRGVAEIGGGSRGALLVGAYLVALAAFLAALYLFHRLVTLELGRERAGPALLLVCVFPASFFFGAPYSESLFLLASVGAFYAARQGAWMWAGVAGGAAAATRSAGLLLLLPLAYLYLFGPREDRVADRRVRRDAAWLLLVPLGLALYALYLGIEYGEPLSFSNAQDFWNRSFSGPLVGVWDGLTAAIDGARQLLSGQRETVYFEQAAGDPFRIGAQNLMLFGFLVFGVVAAVGVLRRLPFAYGLYVITALALPLSFPVGPQPLMSLPRFLAVLFPLFMWLALVSEERRATTRVAAVSAIVLGLFVTQFASWYWVA